MQAGRTVAVKPLNLPKFKPSLTLDEDDIPELKNLNIGDKCTLTIEAEVVRKSKGEDYDDSAGRTVQTGSFKVLSAKYDSTDKGSKQDKLSAMKKKANVNY